jgi:hypothetical protein
MLSAHGESRLQFQLQESPFCSSRAALTNFIGLYDSERKYIQLEGVMITEEQQSPKNPLTTPSTRNVDIME